jgi:hypothetical protein
MYHASTRDIARSDSLPVLPIAERNSGLLRVLDFGRRLTEELTDHLRTKDRDLKLPPKAEIAKMLSDRDFRSTDSKK